MQLQEADIPSQARATALTIGSTVNTTLQAGTKGASEALNRFVDGDGQPRPANVDPASKDANAGPEPERKDFWDAFAAAGEARSQSQGPGGGGQKPRVEPERKEFWDEFASVAESRAARGPGALTGKSAGGSSSIGTAAMGKRKGAGSGGGAGGKEDGWEEW